MSFDQIDRIVAGQTDLVFEYLADGGEATATDADGVSLMQWCAYYGDVSAMRYLLEHSATLEALGPNLDLNGAAFHGHWRLCHFLIDRGANVNHTLPETGEVPLHAALCKANRPETELVVRVLLAAGADPGRRTLEGAETGGFMRDARTCGETPLHRAAAFGDEAVIDLLLEAGADREAADAHGRTPLGWASWHLRPAGVLRRLCYGPHRIHPDRDDTSDHGQGRDFMELALLGRPLP